MTATPIRSVMLVPYCPIPVNTGGKREMWQCMEVLRSLGPCRILSASRRPVGAGWSPADLDTVRSAGFEIALREADHPVPTPRMALGWMWGAFFKALHMERAFGHANPYHRWAFPLPWWRRHTADAELVVIAYSYWAHLPAPRAKVLLLLDLWSNTTWSDPIREAREIDACDLTIVISKDEESQLRARGIHRLHWSPPAVPRLDLPLTASVGLVGSASRFNEEGLDWLSRSRELPERPVLVFGALAEHARRPWFEAMGRYAETDEPHRRCGIMLMTTVLGMGVQIKTIEALAAGRAIVARRGAMRGIPPGEGTWIEVDSPEEMIRAADRLSREEAERLDLGRRSHAYYGRHLNCDRIRHDTTNALRNVAAARQIHS